MLKSKILLQLLRPGFWKFTIISLLKRYDEHSVAITKLGAYNGAIIDSTVSLKQPEQIYLGRNVHIGHGCVLWPGTGKITVSDDVLLGPYVQLFASNHGIRKDLLIERQEQHAKDVSVESDCWLGAGVIVVPGVTISRGTVVAAGAVVTKDTPPYSIVAGVPAKVISLRAEQ
ncbi:acyltransferase [Cohnella faecalis]|uniref:Acyltransferase n=1 Tax=Cohnella faecalis TaxID=2315694 RepID=A0A398CNH8_9BACL|nr:acyltransferase [Cohnella faecalis]RIE03790.1 acyltransferase [Cohnella faecalis]